MSYAPLDEAWPEGDFPSTYAVYGGLRPELNRPPPEEADDSQCGNIANLTGFDQHDILPCSVPSLIGSRDTFNGSHDSKQYDDAYSTGWMGYNCHKPSNSPKESSQKALAVLQPKRKKQSVRFESDSDNDNSDNDNDNNSDSDNSNIRYTSRNRSCHDTTNHFKRCSECRERYISEPTGLFWWLEGRDAFIMIGGLILLTLVGILIKRS